MKLLWSLKWQLFSSDTFLRNISYIIKIYKVHDMNGYIYNT
jgi:hypothetical protein